MRDLSEAGRLERAGGWIRDHVGFKIVNPITVPCFIGAVVIMVAEIIGIIPNTPLDTFVSMVGWGYAYGKWRHERPKSLALPDREGERKTSERLFCVDCGRRYVSWTSQLGFDPRTGEPRMYNTMRCPGWTMKYANSHAASMGMYGGSFEVTSCGEVVTTALVPQIHNGHPEKDVVSSCDGCIEDMVSQGIITRSDAEKMRAAP